MSYRNFLFGVGVGLFFAAGFFSVYPPAGNQSQALTKDELKTLADAQQMAVIPKAEYEQLKKSAKQDDEKPVSAGIKSVDPPKPPVKPDVQAPATSTVNQPAAPAATPPAEPAPTPPPPVSFTITPGMDGGRVAGLLADVGLVGDKDDFVAALRKEKKLARIRTGKYQAQKGTSIDDLIDMITRPPQR